jgi:hypothetical protein
MSNWLGLREDQQMARGLAEGLTHWLMLSTRRPICCRRRGAKHPTGSCADSQPDQAGGCVSSIEGRWLTS